MYEDICIDNHDGSIDSSRSSDDAYRNSSATNSDRMINERRILISEYPIPHKTMKNYCTPRKFKFIQLPCTNGHCCETLFQSACRNLHRIRKAMFYIWRRFNRNFIKYFMNEYFHQRKVLFPFVMGVLFGVSVMAVLFQQFILSVNGTERYKEVFELEAVKTEVIKPPSIIEEDKIQLQQEAKLKTRIFVGVITAEKYLATRSLVVNNTWGKQVNKLEFFTQHGSRDKYGVPLVNLKRANDSEYPPQKKAFEMLKYICANHVDDFEWFVRADDDVYIRVKLLKRFLTQFDSDRVIYMGQPGHGVPDVRHKLGLNGHNFCMGGPGVFFNRKALKALCPHLDDCMKDVVSKEEDVEIGRCVIKHLHIECTHAWEALRLFYHSYQGEYDEEKPFSGNLAENNHVDNALTLHFIKIPYIMYKVHRHYTNKLLNSTIQELHNLRDELRSISARLPIDQQSNLADENPVPAPFKPKRSTDVNTWKSFNTMSFFRCSPTDVANDITNDLLADLMQIGETGIDVAIGYPWSHEFTFNHVIDGYLRSDAIRGTDYLLDVCFRSKQQNVPDETRRIHLLRPAAEFEVDGIRWSSQGGDHAFIVIVAVPLSKAAEFEAFMRNYYEPAFLVRHSDYAVLIVVPMGFNEKKNLLNNVSLSPSPENVIDRYRTMYSSSTASRNLLICLKSLDEKASVEDAFTQGIVHAEQLQHIGPRQVGMVEPVVLLTSPNISLNPDVRVSCIKRSGVSSIVTSNNGFNLTDHRLKKRLKEKHLLSQIYQPIPFRVHSFAAAVPFPTAMKPQAIGLNPGSGSIPRSMVTSDHGFWDISAATKEDGNAITAPMCGRLNDFYEVAKATLSTLSTVGERLTFRRVLYDRVYAGKLSIFRTSDRSFVNIPSK